MDSLVVPVWIRYVAGWTRSASAFLSAIPVRHCTCRICRISTVFLMPKLTRWTTWCSFPPSAEVKPSALLALSADLSAINASSLTVKAFIDIQDDNLPKLVVCQSLSIGPGVTMEQFAWFFRQSEEQISMVILEAGANQLLYKGEEEEPAAENVQYHFLH